MSIFSYRPNSSVDYKRYKTADTESTKPNFYCSKVARETTGSSKSNPTAQTVGDKA